MRNKEVLQSQLVILINLYNSKNYHEAIRKGKNLIKKFPDQIIFYNATALSLAAINKPSEGLNILKDALGLQPNNIHVLNNIGLINQNIQNISVAREYFQKALTINKNFIEALVNLGNLELNEKNASKAENYLEQALKLSSTKESEEIVNMALGNLNQQIGNFDKAMSNFKLINKINPNNTGADKSISLIHKYKNNEDIHLKQMETKLTANLDDESKQKLYFALGKAYEDINDYKKSFHYSKEGNKIADKIFKYNLDKDIKLFHQIKKLFEKNNKENNLKPEKEIIFIVGMPRSGTSLAEQILSAHKDVYGAGELNYLGESINKNLINDQKFLDTEINKIKHDKLNGIKEEYYEKIRSFKYKEKFLTDKAPLNFKWIGFIKKIFPNSKIIHCVRDPMDVCYSNFKNSFQSSSLAFCYDIKKLGGFYKLYEDLMIYWHDMFPNEIYNLSYEKIINNQEDETKNLLNFCELEWDQNCLSPHKNKKTVATASLAQVRSPIYKSSIKKWENYADELSELKKLINYN